MEAEDSRQSHSAVSLSQQGLAPALVLSPCLWVKNNILIDYKQQQQQQQHYFITYIVYLPTFSEI